MGSDHAIKFARWQHPAVGNRTCARPKYQRCYFYVRIAVSLLVQLEKNPLLSSNIYNFSLKPNILMKFSGYVA